MHSFKEAKIKCEECDFIGENEYTRDVHIGERNWNCIFFHVRCINVLGVAMMDVTLNLKPLVKLRLTYQLNLSLQL